MVNSHLANIRWLAIASDGTGEDWYEKCVLLDQTLESYGLDLSEEAVYLIYSDTPEEILDGNGHCLIARPVIGPKREVEAPLSLFDWKAAPVWREKLKGEALVDLLEEAQDARLKATGAPKPFAKSFMLVVKRNLKPDLQLEVETIFHE